MKGIKRRLLGIVMAFCMVIGMLPETGITVFAEETTPAKVFLINLAGGDKILTKMEYACLFALYTEGVSLKEDKGIIKSSKDTELFNINVKGEEAYVKLAEGVTSSNNIQHTISDDNRTVIKEQNGGSDLLAGYDKVYIVFPSSGLTWNEDNTITQTILSSDVRYSITDVYVNGTSMNAQAKELEEAKTAIDAKESSFTFDPSAYIMENGVVEGTANYTIELQRIYSVRGPVGPRTRSITKFIYTSRELTFEKLAAPSNVTLDGKTVSWSPVSGATGYEVVLEKQASATEIVATKKVTSSYCSLAEDMKDGEAYVVRITAIDDNSKKLPSDAAYWYPSLTIQIPLGKSNVKDLSAQENIGIFALCLSGELTVKSEGDVAFYYSKSEPDKLLFSIDNKTSELIVGETVTTDDKVMYIYPEKDRKTARYRDIILSFVDKAVISPTPVVTETPLVSETPIVTETPVVSGTPVVTVTPIETTAPVGTETPVVSGTPIVAETPAVSETPVESVAPIVTAAPLESMTPVVTTAPAVSVAPGVSTAPAVTATPVVSGAPIESGAPVGTAAPVVSGTPVTSAPPVSHIHSLVKVIGKEATCLSEGSKEYYVCKECGICFEDAEGKKEITDLNSLVIPKSDHKIIETVERASMSQDGKIEKQCAVCGQKFPSAMIVMVAKVAIAKNGYNYDGKVKTPGVTVKDDEGNALVKGKDYTITYAKGRKNVGKYAVKITLTGNYTGSKTLYFTISPKATSVSSVKAGAKKITVKWKKQTSQTTGYEIQYGTDSKFKSAKTKTVSKNKTVAATISKLKAKKKYYVRIRTYKTVKVNGKSTKIYSGWSKVKTVKTK